MEPRIDIIEHTTSASVVVAITDPLFPSREGEDGEGSVSYLVAGKRWSGVVLGLRITGCITASRRSTEFCDVCRLAIKNP
jgi:hypothetical protein